MSSCTPESGQCSNGPLLFSASGLPDGLSLDAGTGLITCVLLHNLANCISPTREFSITLPSVMNILIAVHEMAHR